jgi:ferredoxin
MDAFRSIPGYPTPNWDSANQRSGEHLPSEATYEQVRGFTRQILQRVKQGESITYESEISTREILHTLPLAWFNKKAINKHTVDAAKCILCRTCVKKCPTAAIHPEKQFVDRDRCLACFGCLNNCPADAVVMEYRGKRLYGFPEYLRRRKLTILEPQEFQTCRL